MDIVNWLYLKKAELIRETIDSPDDLVLLGADVSFEKRGDKYLTYAVPVSLLTGGAGITLKTNGVNNVVQNVLDLVEGSNITLTDNGDGSVTIDSTGGTGGVTSIIAGTNVSITSTGPGGTGNVTINGDVYNGDQGVYKDTTGANDRFMLGAPIGSGNTISFQVDREVDVDDKKFFINGAEPIYGTDGMVNIVGNGSGLGGFMLNISTLTGLGAYISALSGYGYEIYQGSSSYIETKSNTEEDALRIGRTTITTSPGYDKKTSLSFLLPDKTNGAGIPAFGSHIVSGYEPNGAAILHSTYLGLDAYDLTGTTRKRVATFYGEGYVNFEAYGIGTYLDPSPAYALGVDASGNVVEHNIIPATGLTRMVDTPGTFNVDSTWNDVIPLNFAISPGKSYSFKAVISYSIFDETDGGTIWAAFDTYPGTYASSSYYCQVWDGSGLVTYPSNEVGLLPSTSSVSSTTYNSRSNIAIVEGVISNVSVGGNIQIKGLGKSGGLGGNTVTYLEGSSLTIYELP